MRRIQVLYDEATIARRIEAMAGEIQATQPKNLLVIAVLKGSYMFAADLLRALHRKGMAPQVEFIHLSSYNDGTVSSGHVRILKDIDSSVAGRDVMLVDDILESGLTLSFARSLLLEFGTLWRNPAVPAGKQTLLRRPPCSLILVVTQFINCWP